MLSMGRMTDSVLRKTPRTKGKKCARYSLCKNGVLVLFDVHAKQGRWIEENGFARYLDLKNKGDREIIMNAIQYGDESIEVIDKED